MVRTSTKRALFKGTGKAMSSRKSLSRTMAAINKCDVCARVAMPSGTCDSCVQKAIALDTKQREAIVPQVGVLVTVNGDAFVVELAQYAETTEFLQGTPVEQDETCVRKQGFAGARTLFSALQLDDAESDAENGFAKAVAEALRCFTAGGNGGAIRGNVLFMGPEGMSLRQPEIYKIMRAV